MLLVGLTGGIATGKSTVSKRLRDHYNVPVVDADVVAREVVAPGAPAYNSIVKHFSSITPELLQEDRTLNRAALGKTVFENEEHRKVLNSIVHPAVRKGMALSVIKAWVRGYSMVVLDVPLLFESRLDRFCATTIVIHTGEDLQLQRLLSRDTGLSQAEAKSRMDSQIPISKKIMLADHVVDNNGTLEELYTNLDKVISKIRPSKIRTLLEWFPPIGIFMALLTYLTK